MADPTNPLPARLDKARHELLDLTLRNALLNTRLTGRTRHLRIVDENADEVYRQLIEGQSFLFLPGDEEKTYPASIEWPTGERPKAKAVEPTPAAAVQVESEVPDDMQAAPLADDEVVEDLPEHHRDANLQTALTPELLQYRLRRTYFDARTDEQEKGVSTLFLALGMLRWYEEGSDNSPRHAPLLLVPVQLHRAHVRSQFRLTLRDGEEVGDNLSLAAKLQVDFGIQLPELPPLDETFKPSKYFESIAAACAGQNRWRIVPHDMVLGFFSFARFLMYRDLDSTRWPEDRSLALHPLIDSLLNTGFRTPTVAPPATAVKGPAHLPMETMSMGQVVDADSSQTLVVQSVSEGRNLVVQGPPGTGKSQTITNIIAWAIRNQKRVLFVAEKMAALDVVRRRLDKVGLGPACLELHSNKASKKVVLEQLRQTLEMPRPAGSINAQLADHLVDSGSRLTAHAQRLHQPLVPAERTPFAALGELTRLRDTDVPSPGFTLPEADQWNTNEWHARHQLLKEIVEHGSAVGVPAESPFRGVSLDPLLPSDLERLASRWQDTCASIEQLDGRASAFAGSINCAEPTTFTFIGKLVRLGEHLQVAPPLDKASIVDPVWSQQPRDIAELVVAGLRFITLQDQLKDQVTTAAWQTDAAKLAEARAHLNTYGRSWFRWFFGSYRQARSTLAGLCLHKLPPTLAERLALLDALIEGKQCAAVIEEDAAIGQRAFGTMWRGARSDFPALDAIRQWIDKGLIITLPVEVRQIYAALSDPQAAITESKALAADLDRVTAQCNDLMSFMKLDPAAAFAVEADTSLADALNKVPLADLIARLQAWSADREGLSRWINFRLRFSKLADAGLTPIAEQLYEGQIPFEQATDAFAYITDEAVLRKAFTDHPELAAFDGKSQDQIRGRFCDLDEKQFDQAQTEIRTGHYRRVEPLKGGSIGMVNLIRQELNKKRNHLPIRVLLERANLAIQQMKPVFLMSPLSVAQYLPPGAVDFDLMVMDEASQVRPVDALGAIARAAQIVVVGDDKQLPPTHFFSAATAAEADDPDTESMAITLGDLESILDLCQSQGMASRMLRWHYRSRHHSLIALSNREFYDNQLNIIPSPTDEAAVAPGLVYHAVPDGVYDRGGTQTNRVEAKAIAQRCLEHAQTHPNWSLGVAAFSIKQRDAILDELEAMRRAHPELETFFNENREDPFFVKNLENVQGDERDVILISVGYARDKNGALTMNFGPLSAEGGERRLNVLITRAKLACEVFSSLRAEDIDLMRASGRGPAALKAFLAYAQQRTERAKSTTPPTTGEAAGKAKSTLELQMAATLRKEGYQVDHQVGLAGLFVDLAILDPEQPGRYLLGIELDGPWYYESPMARERERTRSAVLQLQGWYVLRVWAMDWLRRPAEQLQRIKQALEDAKAGWQRRHEAATAPPPPLPPPPAVEDPIDLPTTGEPANIDDDAATSSLPVVPYQAAEVELSASLKKRDLSETPASKLAPLVQKIVALEGPVHREEIHRRLLAAWNKSRSGSRIQQQLDEGITTAVASGEVVEYLPNFFGLPNQETTAVRCRKDTPSRGLSEPSLLPPDEIQFAIQTVMKSAVAAPRDEVANEVAKALGARSATGNLKQYLELQIDALIRQHLLIESNGVLTVRSA